MSTTSALLLILFATHVLGGVAAFGSSLLAMPVFLALGVGLPEAVGLLLIVGLAQAVQMAWLAGRDADRRVLGRMVLGMGVGLPVGFLLAGWLPTVFVHALLGAVLLAAGVSHWIERCRGPGWYPGPALLNGLLLVGGVIHGAFGTGGAAVTVYGRYALPEKAAFRGTLSVMWVIITVPLLAGVCWRDGVGRETLALAIGAVPVVLLATWIGHRLALHLPRRFFSDLVAALLCAGGIFTLTRIFA